MKNIYKLFLVSVLIVGTLLNQSCETTQLELLDNPNNLTSGDPQFLLNNIQSSYRGSMQTFNDRSSELTRIDYMFGRNYFSNYGSGTMNGVWGSLYSTIIPDIQAIAETATEDNDVSHFLGIGKVLQAHLIMLMVDFLGDIAPMSEAGNPAEFPLPTPTSDGGASSYNDAIALLDEAIGLLNGAGNSGVQDLFYGDLTGGNSDRSKWIKLANTLKLRAYLTTGNTGGFNTIIGGGNFISSTADDFEFSYGTLLAPVNTQHQDYQNDYTSAGANIYQNHWLVNNMQMNNDPRIRYYMTRQNACTPGATCNPAGNGETLGCSLQNVPAHLQGTPDEDIWCFLENGYWGRPHGNDEGIPPDNFTRTAVGVYPAAGMFDDDTYRNVNLGLGGNGAGIEPIVLASYVDFWRAEVALAGGQAASAATHLQNGLTKSIAKVQTFGGLDGAADLAGFEPSAGDVTTYINNMVAAFSGATGSDQWNILGEQYFVTLFGGGSDAHNFYRRTGYPNTVSSSIDPNPGNYPRTFLYPSNEVGANPNFIQRNDNNAAVFWNTQPLPSSN